MEEVVGFLFNLEVQVNQEPQVGLVTGSDGQAVDVDSLMGGVDQPQIQAKGLGGKRAQNLTYTAPDELGEAEARRAEPEQDPYAGTGRNAPCPCGSGKKFKACHGKKS